MIRTWQLGIKSLLLHPLRSLLTVLGIFIGVASVIWLLAIARGIGLQAQRQIEDLGATNVIVRSKKPSGQTEGGNSFFLDYGLKRTDYEVLTETLSTVNEVLRIRELDASVKYGKQEELEIRLVGCEPDYAEVMGLELSDGTFITPTDLDRGTNHCVLAHEVASHLFPLEEPLGKTVLINEAAFVVAGVIEPRAPMAGIGGSLAAQDFNRDVYVPITGLWRRFGDIIYIQRSGSRSGEIVELSQLTFQVSDPDKVMQTSELIRQTLKSRHTQEDYSIVVPRELIEQAKVTQMMFMILMVLIAGISLLVGGIGIMNIMLATVTERTREIGIRRALGAKRGDIVVQFLIETVVLSVVGGAVGVLIGFACPWVVGTLRDVFAWTAPDLIETLPSVVREMRPVVVLWSIPLAFFIAVATGVVFGIYPAYRAAMMDPIEALRHE